MKKSDFEYELPVERIAQHPPERRGDSRLLFLSAGSGAPLHLSFSDLPSLLRPGDCLVRNDTRVLPARLLGRSPGTGGAIELLLLRRLLGDDWEVLVKPGRRAHAGSRFEFQNATGSGVLSAEILSVLDNGNRTVRFHFDGLWESVLDAVGSVPLPPYIKERLDDKERYQTVYARNDGSAAAPTAGLHFTEEMTRHLVGLGIQVVDLTLHVGLGTFRPVKTEEIRDHVMHSEYYELPASTAEAVNRTRAAGGRIVAVGTTACRVLETVAAEDGTVAKASGWTDIFLVPGYRFKVVDLLLTNFHLPGSTLMMLVSAFSGRERILDAYRRAIEEKYRFFSFGDAMLLECSDGVDAPCREEGRGADA
jgi:S-adenosylmethionine:tRNA ribosyltransferase-isomerase